MFTFLFVRCPLPPFSVKGNNDGTKSEGRVFTIVNTTNSLKIANVIAQLTRGVIGSDY